MNSPSNQGEKILHGVAAADGIAHGRAVLLGRRSREVPHRSITVEEIPAEIERLGAALIATRREIQKIRDLVHTALGSKEAEVFDAHLLVLEDPSLLERVRTRVEKNRVNVDHAFQETANEFIAALEGVGDSFLAERAADLRDVCGRVVDQLLGNVETLDLSHLPEGSILIAHDLTPSVTASIDRQRILGFATEAGGKTSHTAILARKLGLPAVVGIPGLLHSTSPKDHILVDGHAGSVVINPTDQTLFTYGQLQRRSAALADQLDALREKPAVTLDGAPIHLAANIDEPADIPSVSQAGAHGVGLFRTEYLFLKPGPPPSEDEQFEAYRTVLASLSPSPVVIRTLDLGGDKMPATRASDPEPNPFLGWRAIRICLDRRDLFKTQLRAILRASVYGHPRLLFPMISSLEELRAAKSAVAQARSELQAEGHPIPNSIDIGIMIEIPAAAILAQTFASEVQFFSIGTNDLTQYTLAVDRLNEKVATLYQPSHPAVLRLIQMTVQAGREKNIPVAVCGEMAGDPLMAPLLIGLGVQELSAAPSVVPRIKFLIRRLKLPETVRLAEEALHCATATDVLRLCETNLRSTAPALLESVSV